MTTKHPSLALRRILLLGGLAAGLGLGLVPLAATPALACSCVAELTEQEYADQADAVFVGRVDDVRSGGATVARMVVDEVFKGDVHTYTDVVTAGSSASCGIDPVVGQSLLVFAEYGGDTSVDAASDQLRASLCHGTRVVEATPIALTAGHAPMAGTSEVDDSGFPLLGWLSFVAVAGLGAMPILLWLRFRSGNANRPDRLSAPPQ
jgi:hypothetical protein